MKTCFVERTFTHANRRLIGLADAICEEYDAQGLTLTLRQLYYQFVARGHIANSQLEYKRLGRIVNDARLAGLIDWDSLEDRVRTLKGNPHWDNPGQIMDAAARSYRNSLWKTQRHSIEVWVEKEALGGVVGRIANELDVDFFACVGYSSSSSMKAAGDRLRGYIDAGQTPVIIHLGDHDPSGMDMTRDVWQRLQRFACGADWLEFTRYLAGRVENPFDLEADDMAAAWGRCFGSAFPRIELRRIALTLEQVRQYNPPPNPAKKTDTRAKKYMSAFGGESWELDALDPATLDGLIRGAVLEYRDEGAWAAALAKQERDRHHLTACSNNWHAITRYVDATYGAYSEIEP